MMPESYMRIARDLQKQQRYALSALTCVVLRDSSARRSGGLAIFGADIVAAVKEHHRLVLQMTELGEEFLATSEEPS